MQMLKMKCFWHFTLIITHAMENSCSKPVAGNSAAKVNYWTGPLSVSQNSLKLQYSLTIGRSSYLLDVMVLVPTLQHVDVPWILMFWCLVHLLELALKDALKTNPTFLAVDEMLLRLYEKLIFISKRSHLLYYVLEFPALFRRFLPVVVATSLFVPVAQDLLPTKYQPCTTWLRDMGHTWHTSFPWLTISQSRQQISKI